MKCYPSRLGTNSLSWVTPRSSPPQQGDIRGWKGRRLLLLEVSAAKENTPALGEHQVVQATDEDLQEEAVRAMDDMEHGSDEGCACMHLASSVGDKNTFTISATLSYPNASQVKFVLTTHCPPVQCGQINSLQSFQ